MKLECAVVSRSGIDKTSNDDALLKDVGRGLFAIADGVGSTSDAAASSRLAVEIVHAALRERASQLAGDVSAEILHGSVRAANDALFHRGRLARRPMLSTMTLAHVGGTHLSLAHCGDSRAYLLMENAFSLLTSDHTYVGELQRRGLMSEADAADHPRRNALSACLGQYERARIDISTHEITDKSFSLLLCSDGVSAFVSESQIAQCLAAARPIDEVVEHLIDTAVSTGSKDDVTALLVRCTCGRQ